MENVSPDEKSSMLPVKNGHKWEALDYGETTGKIDTRSWYGVRHTQMLLLFLLVFIVFGTRVNLSVGIVAMTDPTINPDFPTYNWTIKSTILSSFFWGYVIPQIGAGIAAEKYGPKWLLAGTMVVSSLFTVLIPVMAELGAWGVMFCRIMQGLTQGFVFPCTHNLLSKWIPLNERSRIGTFVYAGGSFGTVVSMPVTGWLAASSLGWPSVFYLYGAIGIFWAVLWSWAGANSPDDHKTISQEERMYIQKSCGRNLTSEEKNPTPWKHMLKSLPLWALIVAHCGKNWGFWTLLTQIPTYMRFILNFNIKENGLLSAAPYLAYWLTSFFFSAVTDMFINRKIVSVGAARKIANSIGLIGPAVALFALGWVGGAQKGLAIALLIIALGLNSSSMSGFLVNHVDIAPSHAGTLMGITNCLANIAGIVAPLLVEVIVTDETNPNQWRIVFYVASGVYIVANTIFTIFGKGEVQYWDKLDANDSQKANENLARNTSTEKPVR